MRGMNGQVDIKKISGVEPLYTLVYGFMKSKDTLTARQQYSQHGECTRREGIMVHIVPCHPMHVM
ncbi:hypothetical protein NEUTE1DRAFT_104016 [Neurospora tetrasperma FGSC 2508]|uniref:Uncharacterized protein n=1 Tax=Neurospora tetrasperma (strain FGSC 2508 / ATCC MYA-4615 / P0657) TaxID=510951 RepID=F8MUU4_NEUT8|nr:uncharacterized protein NEUTE1DRAFT_104016 [Neurospora tetrasperma FGSC 2508]EGO54569.1 hypothetical protein NEUTE1DRAFT_104016 [Neurospora tetrasperma FGSC 2508]